MRLSIIFFLVCTLFLAQCSGTSSKRSFGESIDDSVILIKLRSKFIKDKAVKSNDIKVAVRKGVVALNGICHQQNEINRAIEIAEQQRGVREVRSYLVLDSDRPNQNITKDSKAESKKQAWSLFKKKPAKTAHKTQSRVVEVDIDEDGKVIQKNTMITKSREAKKVDTAQSDSDFKEFGY